jgi:hypothetical protein
VSKKGDHKLLRRLIALDHLLDPERDPPKTSICVTQAVDGYLTDLTTHNVQDAEGQRVAEHVNQIFRSFWWGLFTCYDVEGVPRTNNELERFIRQIKMRQRRGSGRKNVHDFVIRYGAYAALIDPAENLDELLARLDEVDQEEFLIERKRLNTTLLEKTTSIASAITAPIT